MSTPAPVPVPDRKPRPGPRPGLITVHAAPTPPFTPAQLSAWYDNRHIPDLLGTRGVAAAARYQLLRGLGPGDGDDDGGGGGGCCWAARPSLAVYALPDVACLHEEGCGFWRVPLVVPVRGEEDHDHDHDGDGGLARRSIFEVGVFEMACWEVVGGCGLLLVGRPAGHVVLARVQAEAADGTDAETVLSAARPEVHGDVSVRSTLLRVDETRPGPPSGEQEGGETGSGPAGKRLKYLCLVSRHALYLPRLVTSVPR